MTNLEILLNLYKRYTKKHLTKIFLSIFFSILVAGSTAMIAYLLDPAIEKIFIEKNQKLIFIIPIVILITFAVKGISLYLARSLLIQVGGEVQKVLQLQIMQSILKSNVEKINKKHSGKFLSHINYDATMVMTNSGADVPKATIVRPIKIGERENSFAIVSANMIIRSAQ